MYPLERLKELKDDMQSKGWSVSAFYFTYKDVKYIVLVNRFVNIERENDYALVRLEFMRGSDCHDSFGVDANRFRLILDNKKDEFLRYFRIDTSGHRNVDIYKMFAEALGRVVPTSVPDEESYSRELKYAMVYSLSISDSEDPNKLYLFALRRNPEGQRRSIYNSNKTRILYPFIYKRFEKNDDISFCYSDDDKMERTEEEMFNDAIKNGIL